ncbi:hypothetical protein CRG98_049734, partial [Punica granatum]
MGSDKQTPVPTVDEDPLTPSTALLSFNTEDSSSAAASKGKSFLTEKPTTTIVFISLLLLTCIALSTAGALAQSQAAARPLVKLQRPVVLLVSSDGFRF